MLQSSLRAWSLRIVATVGKDEEGGIITVAACGSEEFGMDIGLNEQFFCIVTI